MFEEGNLLAEPVFWMASTLAQCVCAVYGLYLVYYVFEMNRLGNEMARAKEEIRTLEGESKANPTDVVLIPLIEAAGRLRIRKSERNSNMRLMPMSIFFIVVIAVDIWLMLDAGKNTETWTIALVSGSFLGALALIFIGVGASQRKRSLHDIRKWEPRWNNRLQIAKRAGFTEEMILKSRFVFYPTDFKSSTRLAFEKWRD